MEVKKCSRDLKAFRQLIQDSIVRFYTLQFKGPNDINIQLLQNLLTSFIIKDDLYIFMQCVYTLQYHQEVTALNNLFSNDDINMISLDSLKIRKEFQLDLKKTINKNFQDYDAHVNNINRTRSCEKEGSQGVQGLQEQPNENIESSDIVVMDFLEEELKTEEQSQPYEFTISNLKEI